MLRRSALSLAFLLAACSSSEDGDDAGATGLPDATTFPDAQTFPDAEPDAGIEADSGIVRPPDVCDELQLARTTFQPGGATFNFGEYAGDFAVTDLDDTAWVFAEQFTGCESYTFVSYIPTNSNFEERLFTSDVAPMVFDAPLNSHFFFLSWENTEALRRARMETIRGEIEEELDFMSDEDKAKHRRRFHYVIESPFDITGSLGGMITDYMDYAQDPASVVDLGDRGRAPPPIPFALAIDRDQRWDAGENLSRYVNGPPAFEMAAFLPHFFDYKAKIRDEAALATGVTKIELLNTSTTGRIFLVDAELPAPEVMETFDSLDFDVRIVCNERNVFGCSEWDRIANIRLCNDLACTASSEMIRWITPYWRRGEQRWVIDASALLGMIKDGGDQRFRIELGPEWERATPWEVQISMQLRDRGVGARATEAVHAFSGGAFNAEYNNRAPIMFTPPATATKVELVVILSGHGQEMSNNCAEWCDHRHQFTVNGTALPEIRYEGEIGSTGGCGPRARLGAPPGQWGNWAPERAYWCPGLPVEHMRIDLTNDVTLGAENTLEYSGNFAGGAPAGGDIALESYVVYSE